MEVLIKELMDGNPIRGRKGLRLRQTGSEVEQVLPSFYCLHSGCSIESERVKSSVPVEMRPRLEDVQDPMGGEVKGIRVQESRD